MTDRFVDVARRHADVPRVVELHDHAIAALRGEAGRRLQLVEPCLKLLRGAALRRRVALDLVEAGPKLGQLRLQVVLLGLERVRSVDERRVVANGKLAALGLRAPLQRDEQSEEHGRDEENERVLNSPFSLSGSGRHASKCPTPTGVSRVEMRTGGWGESNSRRRP